MPILFWKMQIKSYLRISVCFILLSSLTACKEHKFQVGDCIYVQTATQNGVVWIVGMTKEKYVARLLVNSSSGGKYWGELNEWHMDTFDKDYTKIICPEEKK